MARAWVEFGVTKAAVPSWHWMVKTATHWLCNHSRRAARGQTLGDLGRELWSLADPSLALECRERFDATMRRLSPGDGCILRLVARGLTPLDVCKLTGAKPRTVRASIARIRQAVE
jgi:DNA-directed RNA polymerase specialized sigma24 family protein